MLPEHSDYGHHGRRLRDGVRVLEGVVLDDAWMGNGRSAVTASDIRAALSLYRRADTILIAIVALVAILIALA